mgnify:CR=1 FL=1
MSKTNKILIIVVIVLIAGIGLAAGMLLTSKAPVNNTTVNNTSVTVNESTPTTTAPTAVTDNNYIGEAKAKQIAMDFLNERGGTETISRMSVDIVNINGVQLYRVKYYDSYVTVYGTETGWEELYIGAKDGKFYDDSGYMVTT